MRYQNTDGQGQVLSRMVTYHSQESSSGQETIGVAVANATVSLSRKGRIKYRTTNYLTGDFTLKKVKANEYTMKVTRKGCKTYKQP